MLALKNEINQITANDHNQFESLKMTQMEKIRDNPNIIMLATLTHSFRAILWVDKRNTKNWRNQIEIATMQCLAVNSHYIL